MHEQRADDRFAVSRKQQKSPLQPMGAFLAYVPWRRLRPDGAHKIHIVSVPRAVPNSRDTGLPLFRPDGAERHLNRTLFHPLESYRTLKNLLNTSIPQYLNTSIPQYYNIPCSLFFILYSLLPFLPAFSGTPAQSLRRSSWSLGTSPFRWPRNNVLSRRRASSR